ncbi:histidinol-phosphate transaminase [Castellaniella sp.]|uniref:histidinol-phosphate transaminase n=1 Tax=Castellaniella sp. TaxID=1955812 RepID=UPI0035697385
MNSLFSDHVAALQPYVPGEQVRLPNLLKLNTNENPWGPSLRVLEAMRAAISDDLRLYPDYQALGLRQAIARRHGLDVEHVFVGNGSDEILAHVFSAFFQRAGRPLWLPDISYGFYPTWCRLYGVPAERIALAEDFSVHVADYLRDTKVEPCGILLANPNAPTGLALGLDEIARLAAARPDSAIVIDEAYVDFGADSAASLIPDLPNLVVVHTLSKSRSLAGLRVGYALAQPELIAGLVRIKDSFNSYPLDRVALAGAQAAIEDEAWFERTCQAVIAAREQLGLDLQALGFECLPSKANFIFARHPAHRAADVAAALREQGILVRHFTAPRIDQFLRITVGTPEQCARLCKALAEVLAR